MLETQEEQLAKKLEGVPGAIGAAIALMLVDRIGCTYHYRTTDWLESYEKSRRQGRTGSAALGDWVDDARLEARNAPPAVLEAIKALTAAINGLAS